MSDISFLLSLNGARAWEPLRLIACFCFVWSLCAWENRCAGQVDDGSSNVFIMQFHQIFLVTFVHAVVGDSLDLCPIEMKLYPVFRIIFVLFRALIGAVISIALVIGGLAMSPFIFAWRAVAVYGARVMGHGRLLSPMDNLVIEEFDEDKSPQSSLVVVVELHGTVGLEHVTALVRERVIPAHDELTMYVGSFLGFPVFKRVEDFCVSEHVTESSGRELSVADIHTDMLNRGFKKNASPWEVVVWNGGRVVSMRVHHCVADGLSVLKVFVEKIGGKRLVKAEKRRVEFGRWDGVKRAARIFCGVGVEFWRYWGSALFRDEGFMVGGAGKRRSFVRIGAKFCFERVRGCAVDARVCGSSVVIAGILGGLAKFMEKEMGDLKGKLTRCGYVLPVSGHPDTLCNHWRTTYMPLRIADAAARPSLQTLKQFNARFLEMKTGSVAVFLKYSILYSGSAISPLANVFMKNRVCGFGITNLAGDDEGFSVAGNDVSGFTLSSGGMSSLGLMFSVISYKREFRVCLCADESVLSGDLGSVLMSFIDKEFDLLFEACQGGSSEAI